MIQVSDPGSVLVTRRGGNSPAVLEAQAFLGAAVFGQTDMGSDAQGAYLQVRTLRGQVKARHGDYLIKRRGHPLTVVPASRYAAKFVPLYS